MSILISNRDELKEIFSENLNGLIKDSHVKNYVVSMLDGFVFEKSLPSKDELPASVVIADYFENKQYSFLMERGDAYLFTCGWFPDHISKSRRHSMGLGFYIDKGVESYNYALSLIYQMKLEEDASIVSKLSSSFRGNVSALINLKEKISGRLDVSLDTLFELEKEELYKKESLPISNYSKTVKERMVEKGFSIIK